MNKILYTKIFLQQLGIDVNDLSVKEYLTLWWQNSRSKNGGGLRLTEEGMETIIKLGITSYEIPYPHEAPMTAQTVIFLDQYIDCPYYLTNKSITVTSERKAAELSLFAGDLRKYGHSKAMIRAKTLELPDHANNNDSDSE